MSWGRIRGGSSTGRIMIDEIGMRIEYSDLTLPIGSIRYSHSIMKNIAEYNTRRSTQV